MSEQSSNLQFPFLQAGQAQKHVSVNESLLLLDALVQLAVVSASVAAQPASPADGEVYILPIGKTGAAWGAFADNALAYYRDGAWVAIAPREGFAAWCKDSDAYMVFTGSVWVAFDNAFARAVTGLSANGIVARTSNSAAAARSLSAGAGISISNGDGVSANPSIAINTAASLTWTGVPVYQAGFSLNNWVQATLADVRFYLNDTTPTTGRSYILRAFAGELQFYDNTASTRRAFFNASGHLLPGADNTYNLGSAANGWKEIFCDNSVINTSDARRKTPLQPISPAVKRAVGNIVKGIGVYQRTDAIAEKGADARLHVGVTAQTVRDAFLAEGEDPERWGVFCADPLFETIETTRKVTRPKPGGAEFEEADEAVSETRPMLDENGVQIVRLGLRYDELILLMLASVP
jgi:Protein of unknown function (DUF2793)